VHHAYNIGGRNIHILNRALVSGQVCLCHLHLVDSTVKIDFSPGTVVHIKIDVEYCEALFKRELSDKHGAINLIGEFNGHASLILDKENSIGRETLLKGLESSPFARRFAMIAAARAGN